MPNLLFNDTFTKQQVDFVLTLFDIGAPASFSSLKVGQIFFIPGTKSLNRYWRTPSNGHGGYMSPIVCRKDGPDSILEMMTDFPVVEGTVPTDSLDTVVYPVRFLNV